MDIPLVSSSPLPGVAGATAIAPLQAPATTGTVIVAPAAPSLTTVDLSPLGQFLSATSLFQKKLIELQASSTTVPDSEAARFGEVAAATTAFAVAFNELQATSLDSTDADAGGESLAGLFARRFGAETTAAGGEQQGALDSLASVGLRFNADPAIDPNARLTVDLPLLQVALEVDPATTTALLARAGSAFGALVQAEVQPADLGAEAQPAPAPGAAALPLPGQPFEQETLAENARVAAAQREQPSPVPATATPAAPATLNAEGLPDETEARVAVAAADTPAARSAAGQAQDAFERATQAPAAVPATAPDTGAQVQDLVNTSGGAAVLATPVAPAPPAIPVTPPATAAVPGSPEANAQVARQAAATPITRPAAEKELADRALELAGNKRSQSASEEERAQLAERIEVLDRQKVEQQRVDERALELRRQRGEIDAQRVAAGETLVQVPAASVTVGAVPQGAQDENPAVPAARPLPQQGNSAQQVARDPSIAAAIAAYSLSTGPFAALNARQEQAAQRPKTVPAVAGVARVAPVETRTAPKGGAGS